MGKSRTLPDYPRGLTFEDVWAALMEDRERQKEDRERQKEDRERQKEDRERQKEEWEQQKERFRKWDKEFEKYTREWRKDAKEAWKILKETEKKIGDLGDRFGEMIEHMVMPALVKKFRELGFVFTKAYPSAEIKDEKNNIITEVDITLENGEKVMIVEVKSKPNTKDIIKHIERMKKIRAHADLHNDKRIFLGAVAGMVMKDNIKTFILEKGFYLIEPSGEEFFITVPEGEYSPREW
jgi:hypothetical protein